VLVLGLEASCDETACAVVRDDGCVLSDVIHTQVRLHAQHGGVVPEIASRDHVRHVTRVVERALEEAGVPLEAIDAIAVTARPGLLGALLVGVEFAKALSLATGKPLVGVDHLHGHLSASALFPRDSEKRERPPFPHVALVASGGHTALYLVKGPRAADVEAIGATRDDAAGECFDKIAKAIGLGYPGGPAIDRWAERGDAAMSPLTFPRDRLEAFDFSFSGMKTRVAAYVEAHGVPKSEEELAHLCAGVRGAIVRTLVDKTVAAAESTGVCAITLGGGVAANRALRLELARAAESRGIACFLPQRFACTDNGAMIAWAGIQRLIAGERDGLDLDASTTSELPSVTRKGRGRRTERAKGA
jgi:N6-L-threonylcarbamoyladenine synthase